jgi:hypothetical protein
MARGAPSIVAVMVNPASAARVTMTGMTVEAPAGYVLVAKDAALRVAVTRADAGIALARRNAGRSNFMRK